jgi:hypothetical protein
VLRPGSRLLGLLVVGLLVLAIGVRVHVPDAAPPSYSVSEQAQLGAEERYRSLADDARAAAATAPDAPTDPRSAELLLAIAADLEVQAEAVALPRPSEPSPAPASPTGDPSVAGTPGTGTAPVAPPPDGPRLLGRLRESALASLTDAVDADPGPARVLAAAGANQWQRARALGTALGVEPGLPPLADAVGIISPGTPQPEECTGTPLGSDADRQALQSATTVEDRARYGYEVAAALVEDDRAALLERAAEHGGAADAAADRLVGLCGTPDPTTAGFTLTPAFRADPLGELLRLEQQHVDLHAAHVARTSPDTRAWAVVALTAAVGRSTDAGAVLQPLPGIAGIPEEPPRG